MEKNMVSFGKWWDSFQKVSEGNDCLCLCMSILVMIPRQLDSMKSEHHPVNIYENSITALHMELSTCMAKKETTKKHLYSCRLVGFKSCMVRPRPRMGEGRMNGP